MALRALLLKELIQFFRDPLMLILILWLYTIEVVICAYALSFDVKEFPTLLVDHDRSYASRALITAFDNSDAFDLLSVPDGEEAAVVQLQQGRAGLILNIPEGFQGDLEQGKLSTVQVLLDGSNANTAASVQGYVDGVLHQFEQTYYPKIAVYHQARPRAAMRILYNPAESSTPFMVLSMIALAGMMVGVIHPAAAIVREKERATIEQLMVTPISVGELFFAKTLPTMLIGLLSVFISLLIVTWFQVPVRGSVWFFLVVTAVFLLSAIGVGVLVATVSQTLQQALLLAFFGLFPIMFLSGTLAPVEAMPTLLQRLSNLSPLRYYMDATLGVFLKGAGPAELWPHLLVMLVFGVVLFSASLAGFRRLLR
ncbi:MAG: ABC transporter permease [Gammaproteobacteria bacterium]|nr:ABC transporter permease [Gammaproteobacteria bacterium]